MKVSTLTAISALGLFAAAAAWSLHQQADYIFASVACANGIAMMWITALLVLLMLGAAVFVTLRFGRYGTSADTNDILRPRKFLASLSLLALLLFFFAIFLQASATMFLPSCV